MTHFTTHDLQSAPEASRPLLEDAQKKLKSIPNLFAVMSESPALLRAYLDLSAIFDESTAFDPTERQIVILETSYENDCEYCMAAHTTIAKAQRVPDDVVAALRSGAPLDDARLEALRVFTRTVVQKRGWVEDAEVQSFLDAGYTPRHVLEVILGVGFKTLSNFTNHIARTALDRGFQRHAWTRPASRQAS